MTSATISKKIERILPNKKVFLLFFMTLISLTFGAIVALANENTVVVETDVLNVRYGPGLSHDVLTQVQEKDRLFLLGEENKWYKVRLPNDQIGWVASWLVESENIVQSNQKFVRVTGDTVNIRQFSNTESEILGLAYKDTELQVLYQDGNWYQVLYMGRVAWIHSDYAEEINTPTSEEEITNTDAEDTQQETEEINESATSLAEATIVIDAGHGGHDSGAVSPDESFYEKDITLSTSLLLANRLRDAGTNVIMTRDSDQFISLDDRVQNSHAHHADAFISLHYDAMDVPDSMSGTTTYYYSESDLTLANIINDNLSKNTPLPNNGTRLGDYYVLRNNQQPAILIELGYINHSLDIEHINTEAYQASVIEAIYQGLRDYYN